jgi:hypothetical protein
MAEEDSFRLERIFLGVFAKSFICLSALYQCIFCDNARRLHLQMSHGSAVHRLLIDR